MFFYNALMRPSCTILLRELFVQCWERHLYSMLSYVMLGKNTIIQCLRVTFLYNARERPFTMQEINIVFQFLGEISLFNVWERPYTMLRRDLFFTMLDWKIIFWREKLFALCCGETLLFNAGKRPFIMLGWEFLT